MQFRGAGSAQRVCVDIFLKRGEPSVRDFYVGVYQKIVLGIYLCEGTVVPPGEAVVAVEPDCPQARVILGKPFHGAVL